MTEIVFNVAAGPMLINYTVSAGLPGPPGPGVPAGGTIGQFVEKTGSGDYQTGWGNPSGSGTVTAVIAGSGLSGGTITGSGTISLNGGTGVVAAVEAPLDGTGGLASHSALAAETARAEAAEALLAPISSPTFTGTVNGTFSGNLTGNVAGNVSGSAGSIDVSDIQNTGTGVITALGENTNSIGGLVTVNGNIGTATGNISGSSGSTTGNAATATALATGRTISITGDLAYTSPSFNGSGNVTATGTLATVNSNVGTFGSAMVGVTLTTNAKGLITAVTTNTITPAVSSLTGAGTGVLTGLAAAVNGAFGFVTFSGNLGSPAGGTLTNCTGLPIGTGIGGLGTGVATALAAIPNATGGVVLYGGTLGLAATVDGTNYIGSANIPNGNGGSALSGDYTLTAADRGDELYATGTTASTVTIPANASLALPVGFSFTIYNESSGTVSLAITSDTLIGSPSGTAGGFTLSQYSRVFCRKVTSTKWSYTYNGS